ncbi:hypothetical protein GWI33_012833 [Rhynchophorus ferrugineus]|uniref:Uncharacterized protein n=1 Tax=Rhynchophorus ferrugineus TaxID=354439 RepID=A0A834MC49_RHYFE|nr:hypothetical protein GWI33_012833 [Rhynchophorus ferrugineus]
MKFRVRRPKETEEEEEEEDGRRAKPGERGWGEKSAVRLCIGILIRDRRKFQAKYLKKPARHFTGKKLEVCLVSFCTVQNRPLTINSARTIIGPFRRSFLYYEVKRSRYFQRNSLGIQNSDYNAVYFSARRS